MSDLETEPEDENEAARLEEAKQVIDNIYLISPEFLAENERDRQADLQAFLKDFLALYECELVKLEKLEETDTEVAYLVQFSNLKGEPKLLFYAEMVFSQNTDQDD